MYNSEIPWEGLSEGKIKRDDASQFVGTRWVGDGWHRGGEDAGEEEKKHKILKYLSRRRY